MNQPMQQNSQGNVMSPEQERNWAMFCHLGSLAGFIVPFFGNIILPLVLWLIKKKESSFVDAHGKESLNFQISLTIYGVISFVLMFLLIGIPMLFAVAIFGLVNIIRASIKASNGEEFKYPMTIRLIN